MQTRNIDSDSDHDIILTTVLTKGNVSTKEATKRRNYHIFNAENYLTDLMGQKWTQDYNFTDPTLIEDKITELLLNVLDWYAPLKYKPKKKSHGGLKLSTECLELFKDRNTKKNLAKSTGNVEDWNNWKIAKNLVNNKIRNEKNLAEETKMFEILEDATGRELWQMVKANAGWIKSLAPKSLMQNGLQITSPKLMANALNEAFIGKIG